MTATLSYTPESYNTLPSLKEAHGTFEEKSGRDVLDGPIAALFDQYPDARQNFGLQLLHRHFSMTSNEILVEVERTSTPWHVKNLGDNASVMQGRVFPRSFRLRAGPDGPLFEPYEFRYVLDGEEPLANPNDLETMDFAEKLVGILKENSLENVLGINSLTPEVKPFAALSLVKDSIEAIFVFSGANEGIGLAAQCSSPCVCKTPGLDSTEDWDKDADADAK